MRYESPKAMKNLKFVLRPKDHCFKMSQICIVPMKNFFVNETPNLIALFLPFQRGGPE